MKDITIREFKSILKNSISSIIHPEHSYTIIKEDGPFSLSKESRIGISLIILGNYKYIDLEMLNIIKKGIEDKLHIHQNLKITLGVYNSKRIELFFRLDEVKM